MKTKMLILLLVLTLPASFVSAADDDPIIFADEATKSICIENWDTNGDGELSYAEAAAVTAMNLWDNGMFSPFTDNEEITSFDELQYFTSLKSINDFMLYGCKNLASIVLPPNITSIKQQAFGLTSIKSMTIPSNVTSIDEAAFWHTSLDSFIVEEGNSVYDSRDNCNALIRTSVDRLIAGFNNCFIPESVSYISTRAFSYSNIESIVIPRYVLNVAPDAFDGCSNLKSIIVDERNKTYDSRDNCNAIIATETNELVIGCQTTIIPNSVMSIGGHAFCGHCEQISIPESVTGIGVCAFSECGLTSIEIPDQVTFIGPQAFARCANLASIVLPKRLENINKETFRGCSNLTTVVMPDDLESIGTGAFYDCTSLTSITIPRNVRSIESNAFKNCRNLSSVISYIQEPFQWPEYYILGTYVDVDKVLYVPKGTREAYIAAGWTEEIFTGGIVEMEPELVPLEEDQTVDIAEEITEETNLDGNIVGDIYYNISSGNGSYDVANGCIVVTQPTEDSTVEGTDIFGEDFKAGFTGIVFKIPAGKGTIKIQAETTGNMVLKVKIGDNDPIEMELEGKLKVSFPYNVTEDTYVYIYGSYGSSGVKGMHKAPAEGELKIYGVELIHDQTPTDIEVTFADKAYTENAIYNLSGQRLTTLQKGVNIIRAQDGTTRKVIIK